MDENKENKALRDELLKTKEELDKRYRDLGRIYEVVRTIHSTLKMSELSHISQNIIEQTLGLKSYSLIVYDSVVKRFVVVETKNLSKDIEEKALEKVREFADHWDETHKKLREQEVIKIVTDDGVSVSCMPLAAYKRTVGALFVTDETLNQMNWIGDEILALITNQLTVAMENSILYEITHKLSITDDKTGVYNFRYLKRRLDLELRRAHRYGRALSFLMIDIDDFKRYNDAYGHVTGDQAIKEIAGLVKDQCRQIDLVARYGGEEFCVVLPETASEGAEILANRMIISVAECRFKGATTREAEKLSISIGVASFPEHCETASELVSMSDNALFGAKRDGKNCYKVAEK